MIQTCTQKKMLWATSQPLDAAYRSRLLDIDLSKINCVITSNLPPSTFTFNPPIFVKDLISSVSSSLIFSYPTPRIGVFQICLGPPRKILILIITQVLKKGIFSIRSLQNIYRSKMLLPYELKQVHISLVASYCKTASCSHIVRI